MDIGKVLGLLEPMRDDVEVRRKIQLVYYLYNDIKSEENVEMLDELILLITELLKNEKVVVGSKKNTTRKFDNPIYEEFYYFLRNNGKTETSSYDYVRRVVAIFKEAKVDVTTYNDKTFIDKFIDMYSFGGSKYEENLKKHNAPSSALKQFKKFLYR